MDKELMLKEIKKYLDIEKDAEFARFLGVPPQNLRNWYKRKTYDEIILISKIPELNSVWLLTGEGSMLKNENNLAESENNSMQVQTVPLLPILARGGSLNDFTVSIHDTDCERIISPIQGADFAIQIAGDSMAPEYPSGSQVLVKRINEKAFIEWGKTYVLDTCNGSIIKTLMPSNSEGVVKCVSINTNYPPFEVSLTDVYGIYRVMMLMSIK
ncbi:MAG: S24 family peptidase [Rikenellaceae bacterium]